MISDKKNQVNNIIASGDVKVDASLTLKKVSVSFSETTSDINISMPDVNNFYYDYKALDTETLSNGTIGILYAADTGGGIYKLYFSAWNPDTGTISPSAILVSSTYLAAPDQKCFLNKFSNGSLWVTFMTSDKTQIVSCTGNSTGSSWSNHRIVASAGGSTQVQEYGINHANTTWDTAGGWTELSVAGKTMKRTTSGGAYVIVEAPCTKIDLRTYVDSNTGAVGVYEEVSGQWKKISTLSLYGSGSGTDKRGTTYTTTTYGQTSSNFNINTKSGCTITPISGIWNTFTISGASNGTCLILRDDKVPGDQNGKSIEIEFYGAYLNLVTYCLAADGTTGDIAVEVYRDGTWHEEGVKKTADYPNGWNQVQVFSPRTENGHRKIRLKKRSGRRLYVDGAVVGMAVAPTVGGGVVKTIVAGEWSSKAKRKLKFVKESGTNFYVEGFRITDKSDGIYLNGAGINAGTICVVSYDEANSNNTATVPAYTSNLVVDSSGNASYFGTVNQVKQSFIDNIYSVRHTEFTPFWDGSAFFGVYQYPASSTTENIYVARHDGDSSFSVEHWDRWLAQTNTVGTPASIMSFAKDNSGVYYGLLQYGARGTENRPKVFRTFNFDSWGAMLDVPTGFEDSYSLSSKDDTTFLFAIAGGKIKVSKIKRETETSDIENLNENAISISTTHSVEESDTATIVLINEEKDVNGIKVGKYSLGQGLIPKDYYDARTPRLVEFDVTYTSNSYGSVTVPQIRGFLTRVSEDESTDNRQTTLTVMDYKYQMDRFRIPEGKLWASPVQLWGDNFDDYITFIDYTSEGAYIKDIPPNGEHQEPQIDSNGNPLKDIGGNISYNKGGWDKKIGEPDNWLIDVSKEVLRCTKSGVTSRLFSPSVGLSDSTVFAAEMYWQEFVRAGLMFRAFNSTTYFYLDFESFSNISGDTATCTVHIKKRDGTNYYTYATNTVTIQLGKRYKVAVAQSNKRAISIFINNSKTLSYWHTADINTINRMAIFAEGSVHFDRIRMKDTSDGSGQDKYDYQIVKDVVQIAMQGLVNVSFEQTAAELEDESNILTFVLWRPGESASEFLDRFAKANHKTWGFKYDGSIYYKKLRYTTSVDTLDDVNLTNLTDELSCFEFVNYIECYGKDSNAKGRAVANASVQKDTLRYQLIDDSGVDNWKDATKRAMEGFYSQHEMMNQTQVNLPIPKLHLEPGDIISIKSARGLDDEYTIENITNEYNMENKSVSSQIVVSSKVRQLFKLVESLYSNLKG